LWNRALKASPSALFSGIVVMSIISLGAAVCVPDWFYPTSAGDIGDIRIEDIDAGTKRIIYTPSSSGVLGWAGIYWLYPADNLGSNSGLDLSGARDLKFSAKGEREALAEFIVGGVRGTYSDSIQPTLLRQEGLAGEYSDFSIDLQGQDLSSVIRGFGVIVSRDQNQGGCTIYLRNICYSD